jgi:peptidoglycan/LPS O-acetylase OafA/YrhL
LFASGSSARQNKTTTRNEDIQVLRGIAVSLVVLFHSGTIPVPAGYLGVDVFFVISGFLITSHIVRDVDRHIFSLARFYIRRARRLLPATYCTLSVTTLCAPFLLVPTSWDDYIKSLFGALTFTANIFLWLQTGYFEQASAFKPLLHLWSLSIEEQYYLVLPLFLLIAPTRWRIILITAALLSSAALCILLAPYKPSATFFLLPTRVWELMVGSFLAVIVAKRHHLDAPPALRVAAIAIILLIPFFPLDQLHPRFDAVLVTCATAILLTGRGDWLRHWSITRPLSLAGDWSYSIYLVHWPLYAFATNAFLGKIPMSVALFLIPVSFALGYLQYQYVEQRFQFVWRENNSRYLRYVLAASLIVASPVVLYSTGAITSANKIDFVFRFNPGLNFACSYTGDFDNKPECRLPGDPRVALWGDSFAMMWAPGLADALRGTGLIQITKSQCGPINQLAVILPSKEAAANCIQFNKAALNYIVATDSIKTVALSSSLDYYMDPPQGFLVGNTVEKSDRETLRRQFSATLYALRTAKKKVILIAPVPRTVNHINIGECLQRSAQGVIVFPILGSNCSFSYESYWVAQRPVIEFLRAAERLDQLHVIWPESVTCEQATCVAQLEATPLYRDDGHITYDASVLLTRMLHIADDLDLPLQRRANAVEPELPAP